jgi:hypothetical protein
MKTPSGTIKLVTLATIAAAVVAALGTFAKPPPPPPQNQDNPPMPNVSDENFVLRIKGRHLLWDPVNGPAALKALLNNGHYAADNGNRIHLIYSDDSSTHPHKEWVPDQGQAASATELEIKTDKIAVSKSVQSLPTEDLTLISPHVTQQIAVSTKEDITAVMNLLEPKPTPGPK